MNVSKQGCMSVYFQLLEKNYKKNYKKNILERHGHAF